MSDRVSILLTQEQLRVVERACELMCRVHLGQLGEVADLFSGRIPTASTVEETIDKYHDLKDALTALSPLITGMDSSHASFGIGNPKVHPDSAIAYEVWRTIECHRRPGSRSPLKLTDEPLPIIK